MKFAVVDLETTGSSYKKGDRVIQFGCSFVENNEVKDTLEFKINPERQIPHKIELLTGVKNAMVADAPYFFEVGEYIHQLLEGYIFVAHNVTFDLNFLNHEMKQAGLPLLENKAMDTVVLSRILFPQQKGYSLQALNEGMALGLEDAHDAGADSRATAYLLVKCLEKVQQLPPSCLSQLVELTPSLTYDSSEFFVQALEASDPSLDDDYIHVEELTLKDNRLRSSVESGLEGSYPKDLANKQALFEGQMELRPYQTQMMDKIYQHFIEAGQQQLIIEAPAGSGKSLAYLVPAAFMSQIQRPVVISTYSILLQDQLVDKDIVFLNQLLKSHLTVAILKSQQHYVDLETINYLLKQNSLDPTSSIYLCQVLVWLTESQSGDLDEIVSAKQKHPFWQKIRSNKHPELLKKGPWSELDYYLLSRKKARQAHLVVTNHAYLSHDYFSKHNDLFDQAYFIIDEAHHFIDQLLKSSTLHFSFSSCNYFISNEVDWMQNEDWYYLKEMLSLREQEQLKESEINFVKDWELFHLLSQAIVQDFIENYQLDHLEDYEILDQVIQSSDWSNLLMNQLQEYGQLFSSLQLQLQSGLNIFLNHYKDYPTAEQLKIDRLYHFYKRLNEYAELFEQILLQVEQPEESYLWIKKFSRQEGKQFYIYRFQHRLFQDRLEQLFSMKALSYVTSDAQPIQQVYQEKGLKQALDCFSVDRPFNYKEQTAILLPQQLLPIKHLSAAEYEKMLAYYLNLILSHSEQPALVLFNSLASLEAVYHLLDQCGLSKKRPILAQGIHGSKHRLVKKFKKIKQPILLGSHSFWEGIDLPADALSLVIVTRMPFESPDDVWHHIRMQSLAIPSTSSFYRLSLPRAKQKLKQAFGRLTRTPEDRGMMVILDDRFIHSSYARDLQAAIPAETPIYQLRDEQLETIDRFFKKNE